MRASLLILSLTTPAFANSTRVLADEAGERCQDKATRIAKQYFKVAYTSEKIGIVVSKEDTITVLNFKNTTPGYSR
ncbi:MAG: hypothetical protein PHY93_10840 [Bacteriovorax sp.]|nr:hypothetical protein [Bacteriovorax sp.]